MSEKYIKEIAIPLPVPEGMRGRPLLRLRGDENGFKEITMGVVFPMENGVAIPLGADIIEMRGIEGQQHLDVKTVYESLDQLKGCGWKPLSVSSQEFGSNWDHIFGQRDETLLN